MAAPRLNDSQKSELVARYREGQTSAALADAYGCSVNTVSRVVKAALDPAEYAQLKQQRAKAGANAVAPESPAPLEEPVAVPSVAAAAPDQLDADPGLADVQEPGDATHLELAIDDADDFSEDADSDDDADDLVGVDLDGDADFAAEQFVAVPIALVNSSQEPAQCQPLVDAALPASVYMLVDKTVELQAKPLKEFPELGHLPADEEERQALMVFSNPRQAKRHCGRTQRVIKVPDTRIFERTASYLLAQGISRVVMEGSLYSLPGS
ncbi:MAG: hypothetical protein EBZ76_07840 [Synechococcaceae bacterium WB9_2_170]|nr:hypothetical protein [Synechococcaceae bacterium WB9_2_170]